MPFVVCCGHCRQPLTVHESQAGQVVGCLYCRVPFVVPPPPQPPVPVIAPTADAWASLPESTEPPKYKQIKTPSRIIPAFVVIFLLIGIGVYLYYQQESKKRDQRDKAALRRMEEVIDESDKLIAELERSRGFNPKWMELSWEAARNKGLAFAERERILNQHPDWR